MLRTISGFLAIGGVQEFRIYVVLKQAEFYYAPREKDDPSLGYTEPTNKAGS